MSRNPTQMNRRSLLRTLLLPTLAAAITAGGRSALATSDVATPADRPATPLAGSQPGLPVSGEAELFPIAYDDVRKVSRRFRRREVAYETSETPGTIIVDVDARQLYFTLPGGRAQRYGIGVGKQGFEWSGAAVIQRKAKWPRWVPPKEMVARDHLAAQWAGGMPGGPDNPLGARALYLYQGEIDTLYRIHGTSQPQSIGKAVSSGCIRLLNADVADLFERVPIGTKVVVLPSARRMAAEEGSAFGRNRRGRDR
jgi:lipoprotein-anchoring transpeptidase ErfK/SrfK